MRTTAAQRTALAPERFGEVPISRRLLLFLGGETLFRFFHELFWGLPDMRKRVWLVSFGLLLCLLSHAEVCVGGENPLPKQQEAESPLQGKENPIPLVLKELNAMCRWSPEKGRRMRLTADVVVRMGETSPISGKLSLTRGNGEQFQFSLQNAENLPMGLKDLRFGYGEYPWICSKSGKVYAGTLNPGSSGESLISKRLDPRWQMTSMPLELVVSFLGIQLDWKDGEDGLPILLLSAPKQKIQAELQLSSDRKTPRHLSIDGGKWTLEATIEEWATNADPREGEFAPPSGAEQREVDSQQLAGAMAAALNFLLRIR